MLAVPLYKGCWLMYGQAPQQQEEQQQVDWRSARSPPEALALLGKAVSTKVCVRLRACALSMTVNGEHREYAHWGKFKS